MWSLSGHPKSRVRRAPWASPYTLRFPGALSNKRRGGKSWSVSFHRKTLNEQDKGQRAPHCMNSQRWFLSLNMAWDNKRPLESQTGYTPLDNKSIETSPPTREPSSTPRCGVHLRKRQAVEKIWMAACVQILRPIKSSKTPSFRVLPFFFCPIQQWSPFR